MNNNNARSSLRVRNTGECIPELQGSQVNVANVASWKNRYLDLEDPILRDDIADYLVENIPANATKETAKKYFVCISTGTGSPHTFTLEGITRFIISKYKDGQFDENIRYPLAQNFSMKDMYLQILEMARELQMQDAAFMRDVNIASKIGMINAAVKTKNSNTFIRSVNMRDEYMPASQVARLEYEASRARQWRSVARQRRLEQRSPSSSPNTLPLPRNAVPPFDLNNGMTTPTGGRQKKVVRVSKSRAKN